MRRDNELERPGDGLALGVGHGDGDPVGPCRRVHVNRVWRIALPAVAELPIVGVRGHTPGYRAGEGYRERHRPFRWRGINLRGEGRWRGWWDGGDHDRGGPVRRQPSGVLHLHGHIVARRRRELMLLHGDIGPWGVPESVALLLPPDLELTRRILS